MTLALHTGCLIYDIQNAIAFADGFGWALGHACAAGNAVFKNFHCHGSLLLRDLIATATKLTHAPACVN
jgi:hypothetical protein